jgi:predicted permease
LRTWFIGLQVFGCTALLLVTGLFAKSLWNLLTSDKGFEAGHVVIAQVNLTGKTYDKNHRIVFDDAVLQNLRTLPGVRSAGLVSAMPLEGESWIDSIRRADRPEGNAPLANLRWVSPGYFETIREPLVAGRLFENRDRNLESAVISQSAAKAAWRGENPIGRKLKHHEFTYTVIGIVADARNNSLKQAPVNMVYLPYKDNPPSATFFMVRSAQATNLLIPSVRKAIWSYDPDVTIARVKTLDSQVADSLSPERFQTTVLTAFGIAALLLAMLGVYGVLSYVVAGRKREIGVRMALGATRRNIYGLTMGEATIPVFAGLIGGWMTSILVGRVVEKLLYSVGAVDVSVTVTVAVLFLMAAAAAAFLPARRAASVDPMEALRSE